jgi:hypothetical protein
MGEILTIVAFMGIVFARATGILVVADKFSLRKSLTEEERAAAVDQRSERWGRAWRRFFCAMAVVSLPINVLGLIRKTEPVFPTVIYIVIALFVLLSLLNPYRQDDKE